MVITVDFQTKQFNIEILDILISYDQLLQPWICSSNFRKYLRDFHEDQKINVAETRWEESFDVLLKSVEPRPVEIQYDEDG